MYARKNASLTPEPLSVTVPEEDSDFERDESPSWRKSTAQRLELSNNKKIEQETTQYFDDRKPIDTS